MYTHTHHRRSANLRITHM
ncbi:hypothetical protein U0070_019802 [Myodes glareolus]|uniref:Uncharacterized protein n=1 Tax=Myodes glareolus TaxID=447135 RepID=A0AAW0JCK1_MYOGA